MLYTLISQNFCSIKYKKKKTLKRASRYSFTDSLPLSQMGIHGEDNTIFWSIYLGTSELFIYKRLTSRHRLGSPRLFIRLLVFFFSCRVIYARLGCTVVDVARENEGNAMQDRTKVQRKEAERTNFRVGRPTSRCRCNRCYEKGKDLRHPQIKKKERRRREQKK